MLQQEVKVVKRRRILVLKSIEESFLYHSKLKSGVVEGLTKALQLVAVFEMYIDSSI